jgi:phosphomannomutase
MNFSLLSRSYDLRWVYPTDINETFYEAFWYAFAQWTWVDKIALGYDARLSSPTLKEAIIRWVNASGKTVVEIWLCSSDMLSFSTCFYDDIWAGVMITASHNPKDQNGIKAMLHTGFPVNFKITGPALIPIMEEYKTQTQNTERNVELRDVKSDWIDRILSFSETKDFSKYRIVVDGGNGAAGSYVNEVAKKAWFDMVPLFLEPDGNFPNHHPNPMLYENRIAAEKKILETKADLGFLFDGDADRVVILDNKWKMIVSGVICSVIAHALLEKNPWKTIAWNAVISHTLQDIVREYSWQYIRTRVDSVAIKDQMLRNPDIIFSGEHSTHYFFQSNWCADSGIIAAFVFLDILARSWLSLEALIARYERYITLEEENFVVRDRKEVIDTLTELYKNEQHDFLDWLTVTYPDGSWWNVRPATNDPVIRLNMEAKSRQRYTALYSELQSHMKKFA